MVGTNNKKKKVRNSQEIAIEIQEQQENEKLLDSLVDEKKKLLDVKIAQIKATEGKLKRDIVIEVGEFIEKRHIFDTDKICAELKRRFRGHIHQTTVWEVCKSEKDHWLDRTMKGKHVGSNQYTSGSNKNQAQKSASNEGLSQQDQEYVEAHENEIKRNKQIAELIESLTGKNITEQGRLIGETKNDDDFRKKLADESEDYMRKLSKQMTKSEVSTTLWDHRTLRYLSERFSDILYAEQELRERNKEMYGA